MTGQWNEGFLMFKPSEATEYEINRSLNLFTSKVREGVELRLHTDSASENPETKLPHYQVAAIFEDAEDLKGFGEHLIEQAERMEEDE